MRPRQFGRQEVEDLDHFVDVGGSLVRIHLLSSFTSLDQLDGSGPSQDGVSCFVNPGHAALANQLSQRVLTEIAGRIHLLPEPKVFDRHDLGALVVAMGMMVDNAIVVTDGVLVRMQKGMDRTQAAIEAATVPAWPLLGATAIAVMAFYPIYASGQSAGEYCKSLFQVVAISLLLIWVLSVTITPLMCIWLLPDPDGSIDPQAMYSGWMYVAFRNLLNQAIRFRYPVVAGLLACFVVSLHCFQFVDRTFFPDSACR